MKFPRLAFQLRFMKNWRLSVVVFPLTLAVILLKLAIHALGWEFLTLSPLFSAIIGATVFLIGFMIAGTLSDYKESERLPADLAASLHSIADECQILLKNDGKEAATDCLQLVDDIAHCSLRWMSAEIHTHEVLAAINKLNDGFVDLVPHTETTFISRLKGEQNQIRRLVLRMQVIRDTSFVGTGYAIAELSTALVVFGLLFAVHPPLFEAAFFIGFITFVLSYMIALITDLDNPFNFTNQIIGDEVSLQSLKHVRKRITELTQAEPPAEKRVSPSVIEAVIAHALPALTS